MRQLPKGQPAGEAGTWSSAALWQQKKRWKSMVLVLYSFHTFQLLRMMSATWAGQWRACNRQARHHAC